MKNRPTLTAAITVALSLVSLIITQARAPASSRLLALTHLTVIDCTGAEPRSDWTVLIEGDRIIEGGPDQRVRIPKDIANTQKIAAVIIGG